MNYLKFPLRVPAQICLFPFLIALVLIEEQEVNHSFMFLESFVKVETIFNNDRCCLYVLGKDIFVWSYNLFEMGRSKE